MLTLREKVIVLYATAPSGFVATCAELRLKFSSPTRKLHPLLVRLAERQILARFEGGAYGAGPAIIAEVGE